MSSLQENVTRVAAYYSAFAPEFHQCYENERAEAKYARIKALYREKFKGHTVLEIAAGTGYFTEAVAYGAQMVLATDVNPNVVSIAKHRLKALANVQWQVADAYSLKDVHGNFSAAFAQHWWSHVPKKKLKAFLCAVHAKLKPGALVLFSDDLEYQWEGIKRRTDEHGDLYEDRVLRDGSRFETIKNFPTEEVLTNLLKGIADDMAYEEYEPEHLWTLSYHVKS